MTTVEIFIQEKDQPEDIKILEGGIAEFNGPELASQRRPLSIMIKNSAGLIIAGMNGSTNWGWLYVRLLWVSKDSRGQNLGTQIMQAAEVEARNRNCHGAWLDTFSFQARGFYEKLGYSVFGELEDFPKNNQRHFLFKKLND